jgi:hypothetical protein
MSTLTDSITLRRACAADQPAIMRLAALDSAPVPCAPLLLAEVDGELRAAVSLADGAEIADPFLPTVHLLFVLRAHATASASRRPTSPVPWRERLRGRLLPTPAGFA